MRYQRVTVRAMLLLLVSLFKNSVWDPGISVLTRFPHLIFIDPGAVCSVIVCTIASLYNCVLIIVRKWKLRLSKLPKVTKIKSGWIQSRVLGLNQKGNPGSPQLYFEQRLSCILSCAVVVWLRMFLLCVYVCLIFTFHINMWVLSFLWIVGTLNFFNAFNYTHFLRWIL